MKERTIRLENLLRDFPRKSILRDNKLGYAKEEVLEIINFMPNSVSIDFSRIEDRNYFHGLLPTYFVFWMFWDSLPKSTEIDVIIEQLNILKRNIKIREILDER